jgi:hypothetical protein
MHTSHLGYFAFNPTYLSQLIIGLAVLKGQGGI